MKRTTIFADDHLMAEIRDISKHEKKSIAEVMREAMMNYIKIKRQGKSKLSFIGVGDSGRDDIAGKHEELLWKKSTN